LLVAATAHTLHAKSYSADRFDSVIRVLPGGAIEVTETVVFRFEDGTFSHMFRELPVRRTDGIEVLSAGMDERELPFGTGPAEVEVRYRSPVRVTWRFTPISGSTHTFTLRYIARGVVHQEAGRDVLAWRALPREHAYTIRSAAIEVSAPASPLEAPAVEQRRVDDLAVDRADHLVRINAQDIGKNGWVELTAGYPAGALITAPPLWQQAQIRVKQFAPRWAMGAIAVLVSGILLLVAIRQRYDAPRRDMSTSPVVDAPDELPPAMAGALASNGTVGLQHAMATLFSLADSGHLTVTEGPRKFYQRTFTLKRTPHGRHVAPHERAVLDAAFTDKHGAVDTTELSKARTHLMRHVKTFRGAIEQELTAAGLLDSDRQSIHKLYGRVALGMLILSFLLFAGTLMLIDAFGPWPLLIPLAMFVAAITGFVFQGATTPLSNEGVRRRDRWLAYKKHLNEVARGKAHARIASPAQVLPLAVAFGLASAWSKLIKNHPAATPSWFHAVAAGNDNAAFPAFIAAGVVHGHGHGHGAGGAGGGAAGGGASGAG
jgi:hypothetical protein